MSVLNDMYFAPFKRVIPSCNVHLMRKSGGDPRKDGTFASRGRKASSVTISSFSQTKTRTSMTNDRSIVRPNTKNGKRIERTPRQPPIPSYLNKGTKSQKCKNETLTVQSYLNDQECIQLREQLFENPDIGDTDDEMLKKLIAHLKEYSVDCARNRQYDEAKDANTLLEFIRQARNQRSREYVPDPTLEEQYEARKQEVLENHKKQREAHENQCQQRREQLEQQQDAELQRFERRWAEEEPRKYRKASTTLLILIDKERRLAKNGDFAEAKKTKREVDRREAEELAAAQRQMNADYASQKKKLMEKQQKEREIFEDSCSHGLDCLLAQQTIELEHVANRLNVVELRQNSAMAAAEKKEAPAPLIPVAKDIDEGGREHVLPPLIAPNDERMIQQNKQEAAARRQRHNEIKSALESSRRMEEGYEEENEEGNSSNKNGNELFVTTPQEVQPTVSNVLKDLANDIAEKVNAEEDENE